MSSHTMLRSKFHLQMELQAVEDNDMPTSVQDDPIMSRPLQKGLMEDWLGAGIYQEVDLYRGKVRGVSEKRMNEKVKASGIHDIRRDMGVACGKIKFAVRVTDTTAGGKSFGELPKTAVASQVHVPVVLQQLLRAPGLSHVLRRCWLFDCTSCVEFSSSRWMWGDHQTPISF